MPKPIPTEQLSSVSLGAARDHRHWPDSDLEPEFVEAPGGTSDSDSTDSTTPPPGLPGFDATPFVPNAIPHFNPTGPAAWPDVLPSDQPIIEQVEVWRDGLEYGGY